jgi:hypothetical protein
VRERTYHQPATCRVVQEQSGMHWLRMITTASQQPSCLQEGHTKQASKRCVVPRKKGLWLGNCAFIVFRLPLHGPPPGWLTDTTFTTKLPRAQAQAQGRAFLGYAKEDNGLEAA